MFRSYYNSRNKPAPETVEQLFLRVRSLYAMFRDKDYFKEKTGLSQTYFPESLKHEVSLLLGFEALPVDRWYADQISDENLFAVVEFLFDRASKPGEMEPRIDRGFHYEDYASYDQNTGQEDFRAAANSFLPHFGKGFELAESGNIVLRGNEGLQYILSADIPAFDELNVDSKVQLAVAKWRDRKSSGAERKESIRLLADVFEFLKEGHRLESILESKDTSDLFHIANKFAIRHHNPDQKSSYDSTIWYSWIFHFYLATYHASIRLILKDRQAGTQNFSAATPRISR